MKLLLVTYYGKKDSLIYASKSLEKLGYEVVSYPLFQYSVDKFSKIDNYIDHFNNFIHEENPSIILWWYLSNIECLKYIYTNNKNRLHVMFNWDDPFVWDILPHSCIDKKAMYYDMAFISCEHSINNYLENGTPEAYCVYPGYEPTLNFPNNLENYKYDISIGVTNLYADKNFYKDQYINRKEFIDNLVSLKDLKIAIYGPESIKNYYPNNYIGFVNYSELNNIFNESKINISLHVCDKYKYVNERTILILGSGGLLLVDKIKGIEDILKDGCVYLDKNNYLSQIQSIIANYNDYIIVKQKGHDISKQYTWDKWAENLHEKMTIHPKYTIIHFKKDSEFSVLIEDNKVTWTTICKLYELINHIQNGDNIDENLNKIFLLYKNNPYMNINNCINLYFKLKNI